MKDNCFFIYEINGARQISDMQSLATAQANALEVMSEITAKASKLMLIKKGFAQHHVITITHATINAEDYGWERINSASKYMPSEEIIFRFECKYE